MNALVFTSNGVRHATIGSANTDFGSTEATINVEVGDGVETYTPSDIYSGDGLLFSGGRPNFPFVMVSNSDHKLIAKLAPRIRKTRTPKSV